MANDDDEIEFFPEPNLDECGVDFWPSGVGLKMTLNEQPIHDAIATEVTENEGTEIEFWSQDRVRTKINPVTREVRPNERYWLGPWKFTARVEWPDSTPESREEGFRSSWRSRCWIPRATFDTHNIPPPLEGDVVRFWDIPYFNDKIRLKQLFPSGLYFNVVDADTDGHIGDLPNFVGFWLTLQRRTDYAPERRIFDE